MIGALLFSALLISFHDNMDASNLKSSENAVTPSGTTNEGTPGTNNSGTVVQTPRSSRIGIFKPRIVKTPTTTTTTTTTTSTTETPAIAPSNTPAEELNQTSGELSPRGNSGIGLRGLSSDFDLEQMANGK